VSHDLRKESFEIKLKKECTNLSTSTADFQLVSDSSNRHPDGSLTISKQNSCLVHVNPFPSSPFLPRSYKRPLAKKSGWEDFTPLSFSGSSNHLDYVENKLNKSKISYVSTDRVVVDPDALLFNRHSLSASFGKRFRQIWTQADSVR
jgi:hypothetical protein